MRPDSSPKCLGPDFSRPDFASACTQWEASCDRRLAVLCSLNVWICCDNLCSEPTHSTLQLRTPILCPRAGAVVAFRKVSSRRSASCSYHTSMHLYDGIASQFRNASVCARVLTRTRIMLGVQALVSKPPAQNYARNAGNSSRQGMLTWRRPGHPQTHARSLYHTE